MSSSVGYAKAGATPCPRGFTLVEMILAMGLLSITMLGVVAVLHRNMQVNQSVKVSGDTLVLLNSVKSVMSKTQNCSANLMGVPLSASGTPVSLYMVDSNGALTTTPIAKVDQRVGEFRITGLNLTDRKTLSDNRHRMDLTVSLERDEGSSFGTEKNPSYSIPVYVVADAAGTGIGHCSEHNAEALLPEVIPSGVPSGGPIAVISPYPTPAASLGNASPLPDDLRDHICKLASQGKWMWDPKEKKCVERSSNCYEGSLTSAACPNPGTDILMSCDAVGVRNIKKVEVARTIAGKGRSEFLIGTFQMNPNSGSCTCDYNAVFDAQDLAKAKCRACCIVK